MPYENNESVVILAKKIQNEIHEQNNAKLEKDNKVINNESNLFEILELLKQCPEIPSNNLDNTKQSDKKDRKQLMRAEN